MRGFALCATVLIILCCAAVSRAQTSGTDCDASRRRLALLKDSCCRSFDIVHTTSVTYQNKIKATRPESSSARLPSEDSLYTLDGILTNYKMDSLGWYVLTIKDIVTDSSITARIPSAKCAEGSRFAARFTQAREFFNTTFGIPDAQLRETNSLLSLKGVGLFSIEGTKASNGRELSPVLEIEKIVAPLDKTKRTSWDKPQISLQRSNQSLQISVAISSPVNSFVLSSIEGRNLFNAPRAIIAQGGNIDVAVPVSMIREEKAILKLETPQSLISSWITIPQK